MFDETANDRGARIYLKICEPRRSETGEGDDAFRSDAGSERSVWMSARPQADLPTVCCRMARSRCYSVDVGHGQLAWKLRNDPRVVCMEKTNIRYVTPEDIGETGSRFLFHRRFLYFPDEGSRSGEGSF